MGDVDRPDPDAVGAPDEFVAQFRLLRLWAGAPSIRDLARATELARATVSDAFSRRLPPLDRMRKLVCALGFADDLPRWEEAWRRARAHSGAKPTGRPGPVLVPRTLPPPPYGFCGREELLAELDALAFDHDGTARALVLSTVVTGTGGVGKSATALHWAHRAAERFPDGQLWIDLAGYGPGPARGTAEALAILLRALDDAPVPADFEGRLARYRTLTADRALLVVLDNAYGSQQVRPLLPSGPRCLTLVTSRDQMIGLRGREGARCLYLDRLTPAESLRLLASVLGDRVAAEPTAAAAFAELCGRLPLTLRVAAEHALDRPGTPLSDLAADLERRHLDFLAVPGDPDSDARAVFSWSLRRLDPAAARLFTLLGLHPGRTFETASAAALAGAGFEEAAAALVALLDAHLIEEHGPDRFAMHDLLRAYAVELASKHPDAGTAARRLDDFYVRAAQYAKDTEHPWDAPARPEEFGPVPVLPRLGGPEAAAAWLDAETPNLPAVAADYARRGRVRHAAALSSIVWRRMQLRSQHDEGLAIHHAAHRVAEAHADAYRAGATAFRIGDVHWRIGELDTALDWFKRALAHKRDAGDRLGIVHCLSGLGSVHVVAGDLERAEAEFRESLDLARELGSTDSEAVALYNVGDVHHRGGRHREAEEYYRACIAVTSANDLRDDHCLALAGLGRVLSALGRRDEAEECIEHALELAAALDADVLRAEALTAKGVHFAAHGRPAEAVGPLRQAVRICTERGETTLLAEASAALAAIEPT